MFSLQAICRKVEREQRLSAAEGAYLFSPEVSLHAVGELADLVRRRHHGRRAYYNLNAHINPTNICLHRCRLCAFSRDEGDPTAYTMSIEAILAAAAEAEVAGCTELHIVGGVHPHKKFDWYLSIIRALHNAFPRLHLKAWTATEIDHFARLMDETHQAVLEKLISAGLGSLPAGGAEIFDPEVRSWLCPRKCDAETWLAVHRTAHRLGLKSNASILYGHLENAAQRVAHLIRLRELQDETGGFQAFVPLAFHPENTALADLRRVPPLEDLRVVAVSRLMLDNFDHIKAYWVSLGVSTAQIALAYGADDLDGTVSCEKIHHEAGAASPRNLSVRQLRRMIREAGFVPVERDSLYRRVRRDKNTGDWRVEVAAAPQTHEPTPFASS